MQDYCSIASTCLPAEQMVVMGSRGECATWMLTHRLSTLPCATQVISWCLPPGAAVLVAGSPADDEADSAAMYIVTSYET